MCRYHRLERRRMLGHLGLLGRLELTVRALLRDREGMLFLVALAGLGWVLYLLLAGLKYWRGQ
jgi:hypothetical protein